MGSKVFVHQFQADYNEVYNRDGFLTCEYDPIDFKALVFFLKVGVSFVGIQHALNGRALKKNFVWKAHNYEKCIRNDFPEEVEARKEMIKQSSDPNSN